MALAHVSTKGQGVIPKALREGLEVRAGTYVALRDGESRRGSSTTSQCWVLPSTPPT
jgi:AbrB family looped-hinge helix DNA binding protein